MAATSGQQDAALTSLEPVNVPPGETFDFVRQMLEDEPYSVHFFQAVRILQRGRRGRGNVGHFFQPAEESIRFSTLPSFAFPPSELYDLQRSPAGQWQMTVQFMGLCAALSALPSMYTETVLTRIREKDRAMADFFDIFNHRIVSLFYRAWEKHHVYAGQETEEDDRLSLRLLDLLGLGTEGMRGRAGISDRTCVFYAGLLGRHIRTADSLRQILEDFFDVPVEVQQFAGTWRKLPAEDQTFFTGERRTSEQLGMGVVAGNEVWDQHGRVRITLGPMNFEKYRRFLPGQPGHRDLAAWMQLYSDGSYETEVRLILQRDEVPACELNAGPGATARLGLVSWLKTRPRTEDASEATFLLG